MQPVNILLLVTVFTGTLAITLASDNEELLSELEEVLQRGLKDKAGRIIKNKKNRARKLLACPRPQTPAITARHEKTCRRDRQCESGEKCCDWIDKKHCLKGIKKQPRIGQCPKLTMANDFCIAGYVGCRYDNECPGEDEKCCLNTGCGYKECHSIRQNLACPAPKFFFHTERSEAECSKDSECKLDERCCHWHDKKHCLKGISTIQINGHCPLPVSQGPDAPCIADFVGCDYDAECEQLNHKCCRDPDCGYWQCADMNRDFSCPAIDLESGAVIDKPSTCSADKSNCEGYGQLCCEMGLNTAGTSVYQCTEGEFHSKKKGQCPDPKVLKDPTGACQEDYPGGCQFDDDCVGEHKCCQTACGYGECLRPPPTRNEDTDLLKRFLSILTGES